MIDLRLFVRRRPLQAGALTFALAATAGAWAQTSATPITPSASSAAAAERAQKQSDRALYWIRVLADKPATKPAAAPAQAARPAPAPAPAARPAPETPRVAQAAPPAPAPAPKSAAAPALAAPLPTATNDTGANLALGARSTHEATPSAGTVATAGAAGPAGLDASPAVGGAIAAPALAAPALDVPPPQEAAEEPDQGLVLVKSVDPEFPMNVMRRVRKGEVEVRFEVAADGQVESVSVEKSTHHSLDAAALDAVRQWRFKPGSRGHTALVALAFDMDS